MSNMADFPTSSQDRAAWRTSVITTTERNLVSPRFSYAQNFEDVYLFRAFQDVEKGFYVDVGAYDADIESVTRLFYELGWHGVNVEPGPSFDALAAGRPRDININVAVTDHEGQTTFYYHPDDPGTSTLRSELDEQLVGRIADRIESVARTTTLTSIFEQYASNRTIHFLKLDVEGTETEIIRSTDWNRWRPELVLVEATLPYSNIRQDKKWNRYFYAANYHLVFFDGINSYYLREESLHRRHAFDRPVNVIDGFRKYDPELHGPIPVPENQRTEAEAVLKRPDEDIVADPGPSLDHHDLVEEVARLRAEVASQQAEIAAAREGWSNAATRLQEVDAVHGGVLTEKAKLETALAEARVELEAARDLAGGVKQAEDVQRLTREMIESSLTMIVAKTVEDAAALALARERCGVLEAELAAARAAQSNMVAVGLAAEEAERELAAVRRDQAELLARLTEADEVAQAHQQALADSEAALAAANARLEAALDESASFELELERMRAARTSLIQLAESDLTRDMTHLRDEMDAIRQHRDSLQAALEAADQFGQAMQQRMDDLTAEADQERQVLHGELADARAAIDAMREELRVNDVQREELAGALESANAFAGRIADELAAARQERDAFSALADQIGASRDRLVYDLRFDDGPRALKAVLPLARLLRKLTGR